MARKVDTAPPMPDGYVMKAIPEKVVDAMDNEQGRQWLEKVAERTATGERDDPERTILGR